MSQVGAAFLSFGVAGADDRDLGGRVVDVPKIVMWAVLAVPVAILVRALGGELSLCDPSSGFDLWVDVLLSPVTWVRQVGGEQSEPTTLIDSSSIRNSRRSLGACWARSR